MNAVWDEWWAQRWNIDPQGLLVVVIVVVLVHVLVRLPQQLLPLCQASTRLSSFKTSWPWHSLSLAGYGTFRSGWSVSAKVPPQLVWFSPAEPNQWSQARRKIHKPIPILTSSESSEKKNQSVPKQHVRRAEEPFRWPRARTSCKDMFKKKIRKRNITYGRKSVAEMAGVIVTKLLQGSGSKNLICSQSRKKNRWIGVIASLWPWHVVPVARNHHSAKPLQKVGGDRLRHPRIQRSPTAGWVTLGQKNCTTKCWRVENMIHMRDLKARAKQNRRKESMKERPGQGNDPKENDGKTPWKDLVKRKMKGPN